MLKLIKQVLKEETGASLIEYVLIAGLISIAGWAVMQTIGGNLVTILNTTQGATGAAAG